MFITAWQRLRIALLLVLYFFLSYFRFLCKEKFWHFETLPMKIFCVRHCPYQTILQTRHSNSASNSTVPNQTIPYHTILQTRHSNSTVPNQTIPYHTILQTRHSNSTSNSTVPNQTTTYHTILQIRHSMRRQIRLFQIRLPHTTQFSKPLSAEAWGLCPYTRKGLLDRLWEKSKTFKVWQSTLVKICL